MDPFDRGLNANFKEASFKDNVVTEEDSRIDRNWEAFKIYNKMQFFRNNLIKKTSGSSSWSHQKLQRELGSFFGNFSRFFCDISIFRESFF